LGVKGSRRGSEEMVFYGVVDKRGSGHVHVHVGLRQFDVGHNDLPLNIDAPQILPVANVHELRLQSARPGGESTFVTR